MTEMKRFIYAVLAVAATLSFAACNQENEIKTPGTVGDNTISFTLTAGSGTRSASATAMPQMGALIPLENGAGERTFFLEETITSLDDEAFFAPAETRGTPAYSENFENLSNGKFQALAFPATQPFNGQKEWYSTFPRTSYGQANTNNYADFEYDGEFWEYSYEWDPWYDQETLLFFAKMVVNESTAFTGADLGRNIGVLRNSYEFTYDGTTPTMSFSYRSQLTAKEQQDILFATRPVTRAESKKAIPMLFYHALSGVKFATAYENDSDVKTFIKKVELTGLYGYGKCYVTSTAENGAYADQQTVRSSADAVSWDLTMGAATSSLSYVYTQTYSESDVVTYDGSGFTNKGEYPSTFSKAGNKNNLNDGDASMTFWFIPQAMTDQVKLTVTYDVEIDGVKKEYKNTLDLGTALLAQGSDASKVWKAGQLRTFTLKPDVVNITIEDKVTTFEKTDVVITNTGNVDCFVRAMIVANWFGMAGTEEGVALGYDGPESTTYVPSWNLNYPVRTDNYGGVFTGLPGDNWVRAKDGFFYYKKIVEPGKPTDDALFTKYSLNTTEHPVPEIYYLDGSKKPFTNVHLRMEIPVQAIEAKEGKTWQEAWTDAGVTVEL